MHFKCLGETMGEKKTKLKISFHSKFFVLPAKTCVDFEPRKFQHDLQTSKRSVRGKTLRRSFFLYKRFQICNLFSYSVKVLGRVVESAFFSSNWKIFFVKVARKISSGFFEKFHQGNQNCIRFVQRKWMAEQNWTTFSVLKNINVWRKTLRILRKQFLSVFSMLCLACSGGRLRRKRK